MTTTPFLQIYFDLKNHGLQDELEWIVNIIPARLISDDARLAGTF